MQVLVLEAERAIGRRDGVLGMVAEDEEAGRGVAVDAPVGLGAQVFLCEDVPDFAPRGPSLASLYICAASLPGGKKKA